MKRHPQLPNERAARVPHRASVALSVLLGKVGWDAAIASLFEPLVWSVRFSLEYLNSKKTPNLCLDKELIVESSEEQNCDTGRTLH